MLMKGNHMSEDHIQARQLDDAQLDTVAAGELKQIPLVHHVYVSPDEWKRPAKEPTK